MSTENSTEPEPSNSLQTVYEKVTGDDSGVITHPQQDGSESSKRCANEKTKEIEAEIDDTIISDGLDEAVGTPEQGSTSNQ